MSGRERVKETLRMGAERIIGGKTESERERWENEEGEGGKEREGGRERERGKREDVHANNFNHADH